MLLHKIAFSTVHIPKEFCVTRFFKRKYFLFTENIGQLGAGEGLGAWGNH